MSELESTESSPSGLLLIVTVMLADGAPPIAYSTFAAAYEHSF